MGQWLEMCRELTDAPGAPGQEEAVRSVMRRYLEPVSEVSTDNLGSIIGKRTGDPNGPRIMLAGHLDEVGFMVTRVTDEGFLKFQTLGGWWGGVMLAQPVDVHTRSGVLRGVTGARPPHVLPAEDRKQVVEPKDIYIDIGVSGQEEALAAGVRPGDMVVPVCPFTVMANPRYVMAKAWDNRMGCAVVIDVLRALQDGGHPNIVFGVGTVQEEVGLRGAMTTAHAVQPDIGIAIDVSVAGDTPGMKPEEAMGKLGGGPVVQLFDASMVSHTGLRRLLTEVAEDEGIPLQVDAMPGGGTDAGRIHLFGAGVPALALGTPTRYIHSAASVLHRDDYDHTVRLVTALVRRLDRATVERLRA